MRVVMGAKVNADKLGDWHGRSQIDIKPSTWYAIFPDRRPRGSRLFEKQQLHSLTDLVEVVLKAEATALLRGGA
jgi:hypothetical protein